MKEQSEIISDAVKAEIHKTVLTEFYALKDSVHSVIEELEKKVSKLSSKLLILENLFINCDE